MVESSEILTVSYGTFSCTLEGFDDSFGTMKAIAEYFRDLAAEDRYFGAEPPTPDAQMLAKIAEREITRRVDASTEDGEIVLRAAQPLAPAMPPQVERPDPVQAAVTAVAPAAAAVPAVTADMDQEFETAQSDATAPEMEPVAGPEAEDHVSSPLVASGQVTPAQAAPDTQQPADISSHPDAESIADKLQRIRAVVGQTTTPTQDDGFPAAEFMEDQHALEPDAPITDFGSENDVDIEDMSVDAPTVEVKDDFEDDSIPQIDDAPVEQSIDAATPVADDDALLSGIADKIASVDAAEPEIEAIAEPVIEDVAPAVDDDAILSSLTDKIAEVEAAPEPQAEVIDDTPVENSASAVKALLGDTVEEAPVAPVRAQVLRLRKSDLRDKAEPKTEEVQDVDSPAEDDDFLDVAKLDGFDDLEGFDMANDTSLSEDEEADLMEELADVERTFAQPSDLPESDVAAEFEAEKPRNSLPDTDDATMSTLLDQADQQLNEPEGNRRRDAIAQLKAAVAATEAARQLGETSDDATKAEDAFRGDLNEAVRPRRPAKAAQTPVRPSRPRPAPLKLVASQRVDGSAPKRDVAVEPRRVAKPVETLSPAAASSFAEFAENMGATALPDLLEAAAAYTAFVEGSEDFSRPQIMKKVQLTSDVEFSREDGLRSFGTLLREGRISKVRNGRFIVSDETRFRPAG